MRRGHEHDGIPPGRVVLPVCPYCRISRPTVTVTQGRIRTTWTIRCACEEGRAAEASAHSFERAKKKWRQKAHVDQ